MSKEIYDKFAPWDSEGNHLPPEQIARKIADWSIYFFGDPSQSEHYHIRGIGKAPPEVPQFHIDVYTDLACDYQLYYVTAPSGFSKTTIATMIYPIYRIVYYNEPYIVISSRVDDTAMEMLDEIKNSLRYNEKLKSVYGVLLPVSEEKGFWKRKRKDSAHVAELTNGSLIRAVGWGGNVRGRKRKGYRITLFIGDDPEEYEDTLNKKTIDKNVKWLKRSVVPRIDKEYGKVRVVGTRIGLLCTIANLMKDHRWKGRVYKALIPDDIPIEQRYSIWENRWSTKFLQGERRNAMDAGELDDWMFERMNEPVASLVKNLKGYKLWNGNTKRVNEQNLLFMEGQQDPIPVYIYHAIDPAYSKADTADQRAQVTFAVGKLPVRVDYSSELRYKNAMWVLEYDFDHKDPDLMIERAMELHRGYYYKSLIIETNGPQKIFEFIAEKAFQKDDFFFKYPLRFDPIPYQHGIKEDRIYESFKFLCKMGMLFIKPEHIELKDELDYFLQCPHLHILDALEMGKRMATFCTDPVRTIDPKSRYAREMKKDALYGKLKANGKQWQLW